MAKTFDLGRVIPAYTYVYHATSPNKSKASSVGWTGADVDRPAVMLLAQS